MRNHWLIQSGPIPKLWTCCLWDILNNKGSPETMCSPGFDSFLKWSMTQGHGVKPHQHWCCLITGKACLDSQSQHVFMLTFSHKSRQKCNMVTVGCLQGFRPNTCYFKMQDEFIFIVQQKFVGFNEMQFEFPSCHFSNSKYEWINNKFRKSNYFWVLKAWL